MKEINEQEYLRFKRGLGSKIIQIITGFLIGYFVLASLDSSNSPILLGIICAGVPYAWSKIPITILSLPGLAIKFCISILLGFIITPIALIYDLIQFFRYRSKVKKQIKQEKNE